MLQAPLGISSEINPVDSSAVECRNILPTAAFFVVSDASPPRCFAVARLSPPPPQVAPLRRARQLASSCLLLRAPDPSSGTRPLSCPRCPHQAGSVGLPGTRLTADAPLPYAPEELITPRDTSSTPHRSARLPDQDRLQRAVLLLDGSLCARLPQLDSRSHFNAAGPRTSFPCSPGRSSTAETASVRPRPTSGLPLSPSPLCRLAVASQSAPDSSMGFVPLRGSPCTAAHALTGRSPFHSRFRRGPHPERWNAPRGCVCPVQESTVCQSTRPAPMGFLTSKSIVRFPREQRCPSR
jgi:hypothetical protein